MIGKRLIRFYKTNKKQKIWECDEYEDTFEEDNKIRGGLLFSFDKEKVLNLWQDYPHNFTKEEKELFDKEFPHWADFFKNRE